MYDMQMVGARNGASSTLIARLNAEMDLRAINQDALAALLGISQGHLSKILSGGTPAGRRTAARARDLLDANPRTAPASGGWLAAVGETARRSSEFKAVVDAALKLADSRSTKRKRRG
jgi:transcriptional regulator with XRE-family HTH domain